MRGRGRPGRPRLLSPRPRPPRCEGERERRPQLRRPRGRGRKRPLRRQGRALRGPGADPA
ncbi:MAG: hypothetical protein C4299_04790 [Thermoleophilia bacterium]